MPVIQEQNDSTAAAFHPLIGIFFQPSKLFLHDEQSPPPANISMYLVIATKPLHKIDSDSPYYTKLQLISLPCDLALDVEELVLPVARICYLMRKLLRLE